MVSILHETNQLVVVDKPHGLNVEPLWDYPSVAGEVENLLRQRGIRRPFVGVVHRLDRPVSGVLLLAKKKQALKQLNEQFRDRTVEKTYLAIVESAPPDLDTEPRELLHYLRKDQRQKRAQAFDRPAAAAVECRLTYRLLRHSAAAALLEVTPQSGKFHQIRAQLAAAGLPILGDATYGARRAYRPEGIALHAYRLTFTDPHTGERLTATAPPPADDHWSAFAGTL